MLAVGSPIAADGMARHAQGIGVRDLGWGEVIMVAEHIRSQDTQHKLANSWIFYKTTGIVWIVRGALLDVIVEVQHKPKKPAMCLEVLRSF